MKKRKFYSHYYFINKYNTIVGIFGRDYIKEQTKTINNYKNELNKIKNELENDKEIQNTTKTCKYTKTYRFIEYYDFKRNIPSNYFIVLDQFQKYEPIILGLDTSNFEKNFRKDENYEITFKSTKDSCDNISTTITKIEQTNKEELKQIQESCIFE